MQEKRNKLNELDTQCLIYCFFKFKLGRDR